MGRSACSVWVVCMQNGCDVHVLQQSANGASFSLWKLMKSHRFAFGVRSGCVRNPIRLRTVSDWIAYAVRSDCVRWRWGKVEISGAKIVSFIFELSHRMTLIHYPLI